MDKCDCVVDCRVDEGLPNDFLTLNLWGKPLFRYAVDAALEAKIFDTITLQTDSGQVCRMAEEAYGPDVGVRYGAEGWHGEKPLCRISGRAAFLKGGTLTRAWEEFLSGYPSGVWHGGGYCAPSAGRGGWILLTEAGYPSLGREAGGK